MLQQTQKKYLTGALASGLLLASTSAWSADSLSLSTGATYLNGKYGQATATEILYVPFSVKKKTGPWTFNLTVPYLRISGPGGVLPELGAVGGGASGTVQGLGDVIAAASYRAYAKDGLLVNLTGKVKLPTADEKQGLGTGETDYYGEVSVYKVSGALTPFATLGYKVIGDTTATNFSNVAYAALGMSYRVNDTTSAGLRLFGRQKTTNTGAMRKEITLFASHKLSKQWKLQGHAIKGFSNASADWGVGGSIGYAF